MFNLILIVFAVAFVAFLIIAALQPSEYRVARSTKISAPPAAVFAQVNDFHKWGSWSPWAKMDPTMKQTYGGAAAGTGAIYNWSGNSKVGEGRMTLIESRPNDVIRIKLEFIKPFSGSATAEFTFKPDGDQTAVIWSMAGAKVFITKVIGLFMNMDKMIGDSFEQGLANLKSVTEGLAGN